MRIGLIINPFAGLGGPLGLKGSDGIEHPRHIAGQPSHAVARARNALLRLQALTPAGSLSAAGRGTLEGSATPTAFDFLAAPGALGADALDGLGLAHRILSLPPPTGTAEDTRRAVAAMADRDLVLFCGGDGTARDVAAALTPGQAMLGIPAGVKMQSGVFAATPQAAGHLLADILAAADRVRWRDDAEIMDVDEVALRQGHIAPRLYGLARVPRARGRMQAAKGTVRHDDEAALTGAAREIAAGLDPKTLVVVGPGRSANLVPEALGLTPTLLGVDAILDGRIVARDTDRATLDRLADGRPVRLVLGVTGRQGFLLGRGNQQIGPDLIRRAGRDGLSVIASEAKLQALDAPRLLVDTGEADLDAALAGFVRVHTGAGRRMVMRVGAP